ncbi:MAG: hypothetical protein WBU92_10670 [Candidatus Dormiibacterota bacterium]
MSRLQVRPWSGADLAPVNDRCNHHVRSSSATLELEGADGHRAPALIGLPNSASLALHLEFGFRLVGLFTQQGRGFGRFWDVTWCERRRGER